MNSRGKWTKGRVKKMLASRAKNQRAKKRKGVEVKRGGKSSLTIVRRYYPGVNSVVDGLKSVNIEVKPEDLTGSTKKSPSNCALARACERSYDGAIIAVTSAYLIKGDVATRYRLPNSVSREIVTFDRHHDFDPGQYQLSLISKSQKLGSGHHRDRSGERDNRKSHDAKVTRHHTKGVRVL